MACKKQEQWFLIGPKLDKINTPNLPSNREVLCLFLHKYSTLKKTLKAAASEVITVVTEFYNNRNIPIIEKKNAIRKLLSLQSSYINIKKSKSKENIFTFSKVRNFNQSLHQMFDVTPTTVLQTIQDENIKQFLIAQKKGVNLRLKTLSSNNKCTSSRIATKERKEKEGKNLKALDRGTTENYEISEVVEMNDEKGSNEMCHRIISDLSECSISSEYPANEFAVYETDLDKKKKKKINVITEEVVMALDRTATSSRNAFYIISAVLKALNLNLDDTNVSHSTIHRKRAELRKEVASRIKNNFPVDKITTIHWDGKLLPDLTSKEVVDRLPIIATGEGIEQILAVPKLISGTGKAQAEAIHEVIEDWQLHSSLKAISFDTTAANTGYLNGTCHILEQLLEKDLLHLPCRHHIHELILRNVFETALNMKTTTGPDVGLFKRFYKFWPSINVIHFESGIKDEIVSTALISVKSDILIYARKQLQGCHQRADYKELAELAIIFLGESPKATYKFRNPGAMHNARWMSKAIYAMKIFIFRDQFKLKAAELSGLREICIFIVRFYLKAWFSATSAVSCPNNDLQLLQDLINYKNEKEKIAMASLQKLAGHLWYLSDELSGLALFDPHVPAQLKRNIVFSLQKNNIVTDPVKRLKINVNCPAELEMWKKRSLADLVSTNTMKLFTRFEIDTDFLNMDPLLWEFDEKYKTALRRLSSLRVVNDSAERGVALIEKFNSCICQNEEQKQYLLKVVQKHRQMYPKAKK